MSTLPYETISITSRMKLFEHTQGFNPYMAGFGVGALVQYVTAPLFKLNLANHNYNIGDKESLIKGVKS